MSAPSTPRPAPRRRRKKLRRPGMPAWLISLLALAGCAYLLYELIVIDILPMQMLLILCLILVVVMLLAILVWLLKTRRPVSKFIAGLLVAVLGAGSAIGGYYIQQTSDMFNEVTNMTDKAVHSVTTYAMIASNISQPSDMNQTMLGVLAQSESAGTQGALGQLQEKGASFTTVQYPDPYSLVDALYNGEVGAIAFPEEYHDAINEIANDDNKYNALTTFTNNVDQYVYYSERTEAMKNPADPVANIMTDAFTVLISGNDSYGTLGNASRSDVNMLVTVNPRTAQILMISLPRDTYAEVTCSKNLNACAAISGQEDKLTHTGIYGVGTTESTIETLLGISINYTVRVNFSSLINLVDSIGGIDVEVEPGLEVERFYSNGTEGVHAGVNHLNGERALAFARERYAYADGDNQRVRNQQIVMKALIRAMMSPSMIVNYPKVMKALSTAFETNMTSREIKSLITLELLRFPKWNIQNYALAFDASSAYSPAVGDYTSVAMPNAGQLEYARSLIEDVEAGKTVTVNSAGQAAAQNEADGQNGQGSQNPYAQDPADPYGDYGQSQNPYGGQAGENWQDPYGIQDSYENPGADQDPYQNPYEGSHNTDDSGNSWQGDWTGGYDETGQLYDSSAGYGY